MLVNCGRLLARVGENGKVEAQRGVRLTGQKEQAGRLDPRTEVEDVEFSHPLFRGCVPQFCCHLFSSARRPE